MKINIIKSKYLLSLFVLMGGQSEPKLKENHPLTTPGWIKKRFSASSILQKFFFHKILDLSGSIVPNNVLRLLYD